MVVCYVYVSIYYVCYCIDILFVLYLHTLVCLYVNVPVCLCVSVSE